MNVIYRDGTIKTSRQLTLEAFKSQRWLAEGKARITGDWSRVEALTKRIAELEEELSK
jgi:hypothetical protein